MDYGRSSGDRIPELRGIAEWLDSWANQMDTYGQNLIALGDFNIDRHDDELWQAFISTGLTVPAPLHAVKRSIFAGDDVKQPWTNTTTRSRGSRPATGAS